jgi:hypothetical protein
MTHAEVERIAFASTRGIGAHDDFGAFLASDGCSVVRAIVSHDNEPIAWGELRNQGAQRCRDTYGFVVRWHDNREAAALSPGICWLVAARGCQHHLHEQDQDRNQGQKDNCASEKVEQNGPALRPFWA